MNIMDFLCKDAITVDLKAQNKKDAIIELIDLLKETKKIKKTARQSELQKAVDVYGRMGTRRQNGTITLPRARTRPRKSDGRLLFVVCLL